MRVETLVTPVDWDYATTASYPDLTFHSPTTCQNNPIVFTKDPSVCMYHCVMIFPTPTLVMTGFSLYESKSATPSPVWDDYSEDVEIQFEHPIRLIIKQDEGGLRIRGPFSTKEGTVYGRGGVGFQVNLVYSEINPLLVYVGVSCHCPAEGKILVIRPKLQSIYGPGMLIR